MDVVHYDTWTYHQVNKDFVTFDLSKVSQSEQKNCVL